MKPTFADLFAGIGGFRRGLERAGWEYGWGCEIDEYCRREYATIFGAEPEHGDIQEIKNASYVDLIAGGFPCQDLSVAGRGAGIEGRESALWFDMLRIIRMVRPRYVLVENVPGLLVRDLGVVLQGLAKSGYDAEWDCISASTVGAPHFRNRVWIVAHAIGCRSHPGTKRMGWTAGTDVDRGRQAPAMADTAPVFGAPIGGSQQDRVLPADAALPDAPGAREMPDQQPGCGHGVEQGGNVSDTTGWPAGHLDKSGGSPGQARRNSCRDGVVPDAARRGRRMRGRAPRTSRQPAQLHAGLPNTTGPGFPERSVFGGNAAEEFAAFIGDCSAYWTTEPHVGLLVDGLPPELAAAIRSGDDNGDLPIPRIVTEIPDRVAKLKCLGNTIVPQIAEWLGRRLMQIWLSSHCTSD